MACFGSNREPQARIFYLTDSREVSHLDCLTTHGLQDTEDGRDARAIASTHHLVITKRRHKALSVTHQNLQQFWRP